MKNTRSSEAPVAIGRTEKELAKAVWRHSDDVGIRNEAGAVQKGRLLHGISAVGRRSFGAPPDAPAYIMLPTSWFSEKVWEPIATFLIVYAVFAVPFLVCFNIEVTIDDDLYAPMVIIDTLFVLDVVKTFFTAYWDKARRDMNGRIGGWETNQWLIARRYLGRWFIVDALSAIPFSWFETAERQNIDANGESVRFAKLAKASKLLRLFRLARVVKVVKVRAALDRLEAKLGINEGVMKIVQSLFWTVALANFMGCFFYGLSVFDHPDDGGWVAESLYKGEPLKDCSTGIQYLVSLYWAFTTLSTVGYGDVLPVSWQEMAWCSFCQVLGATMYAFLTGYIVNGVNNFDRERELVREYVRELERYAKERKLPKVIREEVTEFTNMVREYGGLELLEKYTMVPDSVLDSLPPALSLEIVLHNHSDIISSVTYFDSIRNRTAGSMSSHDGTTRKCLSFLVSNLEFRMLPEGSCICQQGLPAVVMYFIAHGAAHLFTNDVQKTQESLYLYQHKIREELSLHKFVDKQEGDVNPSGRAKLSMLKKMASFVKFFGASSVDSHEVVDGADGEAFFGMLDLIGSVLPPVATQDPSSSWRSFTAVTLEPCAMFQIDKQVVQLLAENFPLQTDDMQRVTRERLLFRKRERETTYSPSYLRHSDSHISKGESEIELIANRQGTFHGGSTGGSFKGTSSRNIRRMRPS